MARHERNFRVDAEAPLSLAELLSLLGEGADAGGPSREDAIACYLSASDGWRDAVRMLSGTFAEEETGLKERKAD